MTYFNLSILSSRLKYILNNCPKCDWDSDATLSKQPTQYTHKVLILVEVDAEVSGHVWTSRTRDIRRSNAKMKFTSQVIPYVISAEDFHKIESKYFYSKSLPEYLHIRGYRLYGDKWVSVCDNIEVSNILGIEYTTYRCEG